MPSWILAFLIGVSTLTFLIHLPPSYVAWVILVIGIGFNIFLPKNIFAWLRLIIAASLGFAWALLFADYQLAWTLPADFQDVSITAIGIVSALPETKSNNTELVFTMKRLQAENTHLKTNINVRLSWHNAPGNLHVGDAWQLTVRLKQPRGLWDTASFDYQAWLFQQKIRATGYVQTNASNYLIRAKHIYFPVDNLRETLANGIATHLHYHPLNGLVAALAVGERSNITEAQWAVLRGTGTNHLFAIAGLHIGFVSGIIYLLVSFFWRRAGKLPLYIATPQAAALGALFSAVIYSALAGFSLPTQRATIMIAVFLAATLWRKNLPAWQAWGIALLLILLLNPLDILSDSFWLSFSAVALIIYGVSGRIRKQKWWWHWGRTQWVVAVGLIPLSLLFFHQASLAGFIANMIAIPWVGFITLPLSLLGDIFYLIIPTVGGWFWLLAEYSLEVIWIPLNYIANLNGAQWIAYITNYWVLITALVAVILFLAPRGFPMRKLSAIWILPLLFWTPAKPKLNEAWITILDVKQGMSAVVRTAQHTLIYDTGPRFGENFDAGNAVLIPFLQAQQINNIDLLMITSNSNNVIGGTTALLAQIPVKQALTTVPDIFKSGFAISCTAGQNWQWDGVQFQIIAPCNLRITTGTQTFLLTDTKSSVTENVGEITYQLNNKTLQVLKTYQKNFWDF